MEEKSPRPLSSSSSSSSNDDGPSSPSKPSQAPPTSTNNGRHRIDSFHHSIRAQSLTAAPDILAAMSSSSASSPPKGDSGAGTPKSPQSRSATLSQKTYDVIFRLHSFTNVPIADLNTLSADPYLVLKVKVPTAPHDTPSIRFRTPTFHRNRAPEFDADCFWRVSNVPASGFQLKIKAYDEDPMNKDDGLGSRKMGFQGINEKWKKEKIEVDLKRLRNGSIRAFGCAGLLRKFKKDGSVTQHKGRKSGRPVACISMLVVGETDAKAGAFRKGECWTSGPCYFSKHFSPLVGRVTGIVSQPDPPEEEDEGRNSSSKSRPKYNFQANEMQLPGPVPPELDNQFVPSKWLIKQWFKGILLPHVLHLHHRRIFSHDNLTVYGVIIPEAERKLLPENMLKELEDDPKVVLPQQDGGADIHEERREIEQERRETEKQGSIRGKEENATADPHEPSRSGGKKPPFKKATAPLNVSERFLEMCGMIDEQGAATEQRHHHKDKNRRSVSPLRALGSSCSKCGCGIGSGSSSSNENSNSNSSSDHKRENQKAEKDSSSKQKKYLGEGCMFTYAILLDGKMRWSEVGMGFLKEAGSKHVILANGAKHVAMSGEFFIQNLPDGKFRLVIDNDSGTYRPPEKVLKTFKKYLEGVFGDGLEIMVLHCFGKDGEKLTKMKEEHMKGKGGDEEELKEEKEDKEKGNDGDEECDECKSKHSTPGEDEGKEHLEVPKEKTADE